MPDLLRALSVRQPWATAIARWEKRVENRSWLTAHRGPLVIHAARTWDRGAEDSPAILDAHRRHHGGRLNPHDTGLFPRGALIAVANIVGCHQAPGCTCSRWAAEGQWHWQLTNIRPLPHPIPATGALSLWPLPADLHTAVRTALPEASHG